MALMVLISLEVLANEEVFMASLLETESRHPDSHRRRQRNTMLCSDVVYDSGHNTMQALEHGEMLTRLASSVRCSTAL